VRIFSETVEYIKRADANKRTAENFGKRWFKNVFKNLAILKQAPCYRPFAAPLIVTAAGPSLEDLIKRLAKQEGEARPFILAVASSAPALLAAAVPPDLILSADGGNWALLHLYEALRKPSNTVFAAALTAALPSQLAALPWLPISDGSLWQNTLLQSMGLPFASLPQRGTVTATALDLAFRLCRGHIYIAGADLGHRDILTHARPHSFERLLVEKASRLNPVYSQTFFRASALASSGSHEIYAQWFARQMDAYPDRLFSLGNNSAVFDKRPADALPRGAAGEKPAPAAIVSLKDRNTPERALQTLLEALDDEAAGKTIIEELAPLLFPGAKPEGRAALKEAVREAIRSSFLRSF
jgi:hypothetical protein